MNPRTRLIIVASAVIVGGFQLTGAVQQETASALFEKAVYLEETKGDLQGALVLFEEIINNYPNEREYAAKSLYLMGICFEKLGEQKAQQAQAAFQRIVQDYPDQTEEVRNAKVRLAHLQKTQEAAGPPAREKIMTKIYESTEKSFGFISPDGKKLALVGEGGDIWLREIASGKETRLTDSPSYKYWCSWSPGSEAVAFLDVLNGLYVVDIGGGIPIALIESDSDFIKDGNYAWPTGWTPDGKKILCQVPKRGLCAIPVDGGDWIDIYRYPDQKTDEEYNFLTLSPDEKHLAFESKNDVYIMPVGGGEPIRVTSHPLPDSWPKWSFDGRWLSFNSTRSGSGDIWAIRINPGGHPVGEPIQVSRGLTAYNTFYGWVEGGKIGISMSIVSSNIFTQDLETGKEAQLTNILEIDRNPRWSPDGRWIAFISSGDHPDLWIVPVDRGEAKKLTINVPRANENRYITRPSWLPDGKSLIYGGFYGLGNQGIWTVPVEGGEPQKLDLGIDMWVEGCDVSPDGTYIAFDYIGSEKGNSIEGARTFEKDIYVIPFNGGSPQRITHIGKSGLSFQHPRWSPDGRRLAFRSMDWFAYQAGKPAEEIWVCDFPGGEPRSITKTIKENLTYLGWSSDGKTVIFSMLVNNKEQLCEVPSTGGEIKSLNIEGFAPDLSPDGKKIAFARRSQARLEYWLVENFLPEDRPKK